MITDFTDDDSMGEGVGDHLILNRARVLAGDMMKRMMLGFGMSKTEIWHVGCTESSQYSYFF
jgi:hypothetical protein